MASPISNSVRPWKPPRSSSQGEIRRVTGMPSVVLVSASDRPTVSFFCGGNGSIM